MAAPLNDTEPNHAPRFQPNRILYIQTKSIIKGETQVLGLTTHLLGTYDAGSVISPDSQRSQAHRFHISHPRNSLHIKEKELRPIYP